MDALEIIKRHKVGSPSFVALLEEQRKEMPRCDMQILMLQPLERLCQYSAMLDSLARCTPASHSDYHRLIRIAAEIRRAATGVEASLPTLRLAVFGGCNEDTADIATACTMDLHASQSCRLWQSDAIPLCARSERRRDQLVGMAPPQLNTSPTATVSRTISTSACECALVQKEAKPAAASLDQVLHALSS